MNLYEKLNRLDDSLVESKTIVKKKKLTESTKKVKLEVKYETYGRYGDGGDIKTGRVSGSTEIEALMKMLDHVHMYIDSDYAEEFKEDNGRYPTTEEVTDELYDQNGDGCDLIYWIKNLTTGEMIFEGAVEESEPEEWDDDIDEMLAESTEQYDLSTLVKDSINHLVNNLGKDPMADDFGDDVCADLEDNYDIYVPENPVKYADWCDAVMSEVSRQLNSREELTENRNSHYYSPYGYKDAAKVLNRKAPEYYYHRDEIEMAEGDGIKLARYAMKRGLPVMIYKYSDPDYPEFAIKGEYHWNDYFYPYPTSHEEDFVAWDGKMFVEEMLTEGNNISSQLTPAIDSFLQDIAQMYETIDYKDIMQHEYSEEDIRKLKNLRRRFRAEVPYEGDEEADQIMQDIAEKVALIVKR